MDFHSKYKRFIEPLYGDTRISEQDDFLLQSNNVPHTYCIHDRVDMTIE